MKISLLYPYIVNHIAKIIDDINQEVDFQSDIYDDGLLSSKAYRLELKDADTQHILCPDLKKTIQYHQLTLKELSWAGMNLVVVLIPLALKK
ncbi:MAG: hypothetical protein AAF380_00325 [Bacteroidota bacterium]